MYLQGAIGPEQKLKVSLSIDNGPFVEIGGSDATVNNLVEHTYAIEGSGSYVDKSQRVTIGALTIGSKEIGGGSELSEGVVAYNFERLFDVKLDKFEQVKIRLEAVANGYLAISTQGYWDIRFKGRKVPLQYRG